MHNAPDTYAPRLEELARWCKALSHPARLQILEVLAERDECICGELVDVVPLAQASVSRHLKTLKDAGLVQGSIDGPRSCYCLDRDALTQVRTHLGAFLEPLAAAASPTRCC